MPTNPTPASTYTDAQVLGLIVHEASDHDAPHGECMCNICRILRGTGRLPALRCTAYLMPGMRCDSPRGHEGPHANAEDADDAAPEATHRLVNHTNDIGDWCPFSGVSVKADADGCPQGCRDGYIEED